MIEGVNNDGTMERSSAVLYWWVVCKKMMTNHEQKFLNKISLKTVFLITA